MDAFDTEAEGLLLANGLIDQLLAELRLNPHHLSSNPWRGGQGGGLVREADRRPDQAPLTRARQSG